MRHHVRKEEYRSNRDIAVAFLLTAIAIAVIGVIYLPLVLYYAMPLFFLSALFFATRRRRSRRRPDDRNVTIDGLF